MSINKEIETNLYRETKEYLVELFGEESGLDLHTWLVFYKSEPEFLVELYEVILSKSTDTLVDKKRNTSYYLINDELYIKKGETHQAIPMSFAKKALEVTLDMFESHLPLGSVVTLNKKELEKNMDLSEVEHFKVFINQRLAALPYTPVYFDYGGLVYPFGVFEGDQSIYFAKDLIEEVLHVGYSDEADIAYLALLKTELITRRRYRSFLRSSKELRQEAQKELHSSGGKK